MSTLKCNKCKIGFLQVKKLCPLFWQVTCTHCNRKEKYSYIQLEGFLKNYGNTDL